MNKTTRAWVIAGSFLGGVLLIYLLLRWTGRIVWLGSRLARLRTRMLSPRTRFVVRDMEATRLDIPRGASPAQMEARFSQGWRAHVHEQARTRLAYEGSTESGEPMWVSLYASRGSVKHWALMMHRRKYELRRSGKASSSSAETKTETKTTRHLAGAHVLREPVDDVRDWFGFGQHYQRSIKAYNPETYETAMTQRMQAMAAGRKPEVSAFGASGGLLVIMHVGWTRKTPSEVDEACDRVERSFGVYNYVFNNCHGFIRKLAEDVVNSRSQDWAWFQGQSWRRYDYARPTTIGLPVGFASMYIDKLTRLEGSGKITDPKERAAILGKIQALRTYVNDLEREFLAVEVRLQGSRYDGPNLYLTDFADPGGSEGCNCNDGCCFGDEICCCV